MNFSAGVGLGGDKKPESRMGLPEGAIARLGLGRITSLAYSPDGKWLAVGTSIGVELRNADSLELAQLLTGHTYLVSAVAFSPDGRLLASGLEDNTIKLWDVESGRELRTLIRHTFLVSALSFSPGGTVLAPGSWDGTILLWNVEALLGER